MPTSLPPLERATMVFPTQHVGRRSRPDRRPRRALDGRLLRPVGGSEIISTALDGSDPQPFLGPVPGKDIRSFDAVPGVLGGWA